MSRSVRGIRPTRRVETAYAQRGFRRIAGVDEAGRGAWAGPVVAAAVIFPAGTFIPGVRDSKLLTAIRREELYAHIVKRTLSWSVGIIGIETIDQIGIGRANREAMMHAVRTLPVDPDITLIDGIERLPMPLRQETIVDGDAHVHVIACASIVAKVTRDRLMITLHEEDPRYGFGRHKGYGTDLHRRMLERHGPSVYHRRSFAPVRIRDAARRLYRTAANG